MNYFLEYAIEQIVNLCKIPSPSGFTADVTKYVMEELKNIGYFPEQSIKKSIICDIGGEGEPLVLAAHVDTLGAMIRSIKTDGRIRLTKIGGFPENNIESENCLVHTRDNKIYEGTVQLINPAVHVNREVGTTKRDDKTVELVLDEIVNNKEDVKKLGIDVGDFVSFDPRTKVTKSGFIKSRHLDDKASAGILLALAKSVKENKIDLKRKIYLLFTTYEEVGHGGSSGIPKDIVEMISVDMGAVGDDLNTNEFTVSICAKDSGGPYDYDVTTDLINIAKEKKLSYAVDIYPFYGSDVEATLTAGYDIRHALIGPGIAASHGYERSHQKGIDATLKLLTFYISEMEG